MHSMWSGVAIVSPAGRAGLGLTGALRKISTRPRSPGCRSVGKQSRLFSPPGRRLCGRSAHRRSLVLASTAAGMVLLASRGSRGFAQAPAACAESGASAVRIIEKPETHSRRQYDYLTLPNGMQVLLGSDPTCDRAAAALCVGVGKLHEPKETPGLAHFCEHMLFLGSEAFPDEAEYKKFIKRHGGKCNAATGDRFTCYAFDVAPAQLPGALDRFSHFFRSPLFTPSATEREIDAVDSEHSMRITDDGRRSHATLLLDANPAHPWHWGSGNAKTLREDPRARGSDIHREVVNFYNENYSAEDMTLAVLGAEPLPELKQLVEERFRDVRKTGRRALQGEEHGRGSPAILPGSFHGLVLRVPSKDYRHLTFTWSLPKWQVPLWQTKPGVYASYILGHEGAGSLLSVLKSKGWASAMSAGTDDMGCFSQFEVFISLTEDGLEHVQEVGRLVFTYLRLLQASPVEGRILEEIRQLRDMRFRFADDSQPYTLVNSLARNLQVYPPEQVLAGPSKLLKPDTIGSYEILEGLAVDNVRVELAAKKFAAECKQKDPWYGGEFSKQPLRNDWAQAWKQAMAIPNSEAARAAASDGLALPKPNPFVPQNLHLQPLPPSPAPAAPQVVRTGQAPGVSRIFHRQDDRFKQPKAIVALRLHRAIDPRDVKTMVAQSLWCQTVMEELMEYSYDASQAGLEYGLSSLPTGVELSLAGFDEKLPVLLKEVSQKMRSSSAVSEASFSIVRDRMERNLRNMAYKRRPIDLAARRIRELRYSLAFQPEERLAALQKMSFADIQNVQDELLKNCRTEALLMGNLRPEMAGEIAGVASQELGLREDDVKMPWRAEAALPDGYTVWKIDGTDQEERNGATYMDIQIEGGQTNGIHTWLLARMFNPRVFEELRTKQQLGYIVQLGFSEDEGFLSLSCAVQSEYPPEYVRRQMERCLAQQLEWVQNELTEDEFEQQRQGLASILKESPKSLSQEFGRFWGEVTTQRYDFDRKEGQLRILDGVSLTSLRSFAASLAESPRLCVEVHSIAPDTPVKAAPADAADAETPDRVWKGMEAAENFRSDAKWISLEAGKASNLYGPSGVAARL